ncbi:MAG: TlpA disulfide reductase family protein, partial [Catalinimonas sp.]
EKLDTDAPYRVPFAAQFGPDYRFAPTDATGPAGEVGGRWAVRFQNEGTTTEAIGQFEQAGEQLTGSFLTPTGDYRFLAGRVAGDSLHLSAFDGNHLYVFAAQVRGDSLRGVHHSGLTGYRTWTAHRDPDATLPDADQLTYLKEGYERVAFELPSVRGGTLSPDGDAYAGKVRIVQIFGTWCPNCMDETAFLAPWHRQNRDRGVEVIGVAFERKDDFDYAKKRIQRVVDRYDVGYDFAFAGNTSEETRAAVFPALNRVMSFPTTIFIDKAGRVRRVHTGFSGPATGAAYDDFVAEFDATVDELLAEEG